MTHIRNQLSFDLWYIFLGTFCICIAESARIVDNNEPVCPSTLCCGIVTVHLMLQQAFAVFTAFFEVVSA